MSLNLPNTKSVEMETWANEGEPTEEVRQTQTCNGYFQLCRRCTSVTHNLPLKLLPPLSLISVPFLSGIATE